MVSTSKAPSSKPLARKLPSMNELPLAPTPSESAIEVPFSRLIQEFELEIERLQKEAKELAHARDINERNHYIVRNDNNALIMRLDNLEEIFVHQKEGTEVAEEYMNKNLLQENAELKHQIEQAETRNT